MKVKNKKTLIAIIAVLLVAVIGVTFAYFQTTGSFVNFFQTATYRLISTEVFESPDNWLPGDTVEKTIVTTNEGSVEAAVRVSYTEAWYDENDNDITESIEEGSAIINFDNQNEWIKEGNYYYYKYILEPNETTSSFIKSVTLNEDLDDVTCTVQGQSKICESLSPALGAKYIMTITKETVEYDKYQEAWNTNVEITKKIPAITYLSRQVEGQITPGDVVGIGETEDFYVVSSDNSPNGKTVLLAKYNILVGRTGYEWEELDPSTPGYGLQNINAASYSISNTDLGNVKFSDTNYWMSDDELAPQYNPNNEIYLSYRRVQHNAGQYTDIWQFKERSYNNDAFPYVYDENSSIYQYISGEDGYVNRLKGLGAPESITGRLLSYEEMYSLLDIQDEDGLSIIDNKHDYWLGGAANGTCISVCNDSVVHSELIDKNSYDSYFAGVRPVIEVQTSEIE